MPRLDRLGLRLNISYTIHYQTASEAAETWGLFFFLGRIKKGPLRFTLSFNIATAACLLTGPKRAPIRTSWAPARKYPMSFTFCPPKVHERGEISRSAKFGISQPRSRQCVRQ